MSGALRVVLVEDEPPARRRLRELLAEEGNVDVVGEAASAAEAVHLIEETAPAVLFLDIRLRGGSGLEVLEALPGKAPPVVVFVTAFDTHAVRAFEVGAVDYLLKPFDDRRFREAMERVRERVDRREALEVRRLLELLEEARPRASPHPRRLGIRSEGRTVFVEVDDILWIEAADDYARLHLEQGSHLLRSSLRELEERLDPARFARVHRSAILRLDRIRELRSTFRGDAVAILADGSRIRVSRRYRPELERRLGGV